MEQQEERVTEQPEERTIFRPGLSRETRQKIRAQIEERLVERARQEAAWARLTLRCRDAVLLASSRQATPDQARAAHAACLGEISGGGCLCLCHDRNE